MKQEKQEKTTKLNERYRCAKCMKWVVDDYIYSEYGALLCDKCFSEGEGLL